MQMYWREHTYFFFWWQTVTGQQRTFHPLVPTSGVLCQPPVVTSSVVCTLTSQGGTWRLTSIQTPAMAKSLLGQRSITGLINFWDTSLEMFDTFLYWEWSIQSKSLERYYQAILYYIFINCSEIIVGSIFMFYWQSSSVSFNGMKFKKSEKQENQNYKVYCFSEFFLFENEKKDD